MELGLFSNPHLLLAILASGILQLGVVLIPFVRPFFEVHSNPASYWPLVLALALTPVTIVELTKLLIAASKRTTRRSN